MGLWSVGEVRLRDDGVVELLCSGFMELWGYEVVGWWGGGK